MKHMRFFTALAIVATFMGWKAPLGHSQERGKSNSVEDQTRECKEFRARLRGVALKTSASIPRPWDEESIAW